MGNDRIKILGLVVLLTSGILLPYLTTDIGFEEKFQTVIISMNEGPLTIWEDEDWELQGWPGNGTEISPYLVENMTLTSFDIHYSTAFFEVRNCSCDDTVYIDQTINGKIEDSTFNDRLFIGECSNLMISNVTFERSPIDQISDDILYIIFSTNITVEDCIIGQTRSCGLNIYKSVNCTIRRNVISNCGMLNYVTPIMVLASSAPAIHSSSFGMLQYSFPSGGALNIANSSMCFISDNILSNNIGYGIYCSYSDNLEITSNYEEYNGVDVTLSNCQENELVNNTFNSGLELWSCTAFMLSGNEIGSNGLSLHGFLPSFLHSVTNNSVHSKPLLYLVNESDTIYSNTEYGQIYVINSNRVSLIQVNVTASSPSINILYSPFCVITQAVCLSIDIDHSNNSEVHKSTIVGGFIGIECSSSPECLINNNTIRNTTFFGISIHSFSFESLIHNNKVIDVSMHGIKIDSPYCNVENNTVSGCATPRVDTHWGITSHFAGIIIQSDHCLVKNNNVTNNYGYGIWINSYGSNNILYLNRLSENTEGNGRSDGEGNQWDNGIDTGNYWGDWTSVGVYSIPGSEECVDRFPNGTIPSLISLTTGIIMLSVGASLIIIGLAIVRIVKCKTQNK